MKDAPNIRTAIPRHRVQIGEFQLTILGDIESNDPLPYRWIAAFVQSGESKPQLYVCSEKARRAEADRGAWRLRVVDPTISDVLDVGDQWGDLENFTAEAIRVGQKLLKLSDETPWVLS